MINIVIFIVIVMIIIICSSSLFILPQKKQTRVCLSSSSQFLASGGLDHGVHIWDLKTKRLHRSLKVRPGPGGGGAQGSWCGGLMRSHEVSHGVAVS